eukprot:s212_g8.t1
MRHSKAEIVKDLKREWGKCGNLWADASDPWIDPETALEITQAHFNRHAKKMPDGSVKIPNRVPYPGKKNILVQIRDRLDAVPPQTGTPQGPAESEDDGEGIDLSFRIGFNNKTGFRLKAYDSDDNLVQEVKLPDPQEDSNYVIVEMDGKEYFPLNGDMQNLTLCSKYMEENLPKPTLPKPPTNSKLGDGTVMPTLPAKRKLPTMESDSDNEASPVTEAESNSKLEYGLDGWTLPRLFQIKQGQDNFGLFYQGKEVELEGNTKFYVKEDERPEYKGEFLVYPMDENSMILPRFVSKLLKKKGSEHPSSISPPGP